MIGVVVSEADSASVHIGERLRELGEWSAATDDRRPAADGGGTHYRTEGLELRTVEKLHLETEDAAAAFDDPDAVVFVSRHAGETGPLLTAHFTGNVGRAEYGGRDHELATATPGLADRALDALAERAPEGYDVSMECTHHGPSEVGAPSLFVELGSAEPQWEDAAAARAVAGAVLALRGFDPCPERTVVAFGGGHYAPRPTRIARETDWAVGHVCADWGLDALDADDVRRDVLAQAFERSTASRAVLADDRPALASTIRDLGYEVVSETWLRETEGVAVGLVERLEDALGAVDAGLRFGAPARGADPDASFETVELPGDLLAAAAGVDPAATREAVDAVALGYQTAEAGNRIRGRAALPDRGAGEDDNESAAADSADALVDGLAAVLDREYAVERTADAVRVRERAFDPDLARERGVPEGPAFGRLAAGESVTVGGETVDPAAVTRERTREYGLGDLGRA